MHLFEFKESNIVQIDAGVQDRENQKFELFGTFGSKVLVGAHRSRDEANAQEELLKVGENLYVFSKEVVLEKKAGLSETVPESTFFLI